MLDGLKKILLRAKLEKNEFFKNVTFEKESKIIKMNKKTQKILSKNIEKNVKRILVEWVFYLQKYKEIKIKKFEDLFSGVDEIVFPIKVIECSGNKYIDIEIQIKDNKGKKYFIEFNIFYKYIQNYTIDKIEDISESEIYNEMTYRICKNNSIKLINKRIIRFKKYEKEEYKRDIEVELSYELEKNITKYVLKSIVGNRKIEITCSTIDEEFEKNLLSYIFCINDNEWYYYNVVPILKWIVNTISDEKISTSIKAEIEGEIVSEIDVQNGYVQKYTTTIIINESEVNIVKRILSKELKSFLKQNN